MTATKAMNGSHVRTVSAVVDAGARNRAARNPATAGQSTAMRVSIRPWASRERHRRMMMRCAETSMISRTVTATRENRAARPTPRPAPVIADQMTTMIASPIVPGTPRIRRPTTIADTGVAGFQRPCPAPCCPVLPSLMSPPRPDG